MTYRHSTPAAALLLLVVAAACSSSSSVEAEIRNVIETQQAAWNRGDIDAFMDGYERADMTTFVSGDQLTRGWQNMLDRYKTSYSSRELMGELRFSDLEIQPIGSDHAIADGRWALKRATDMPHGRFTLIFRKASNGWRITHDTTTSAP
jgi:ketosteroid isomerase-like protein